MIHPNPLRPRHPNMNLMFRPSSLLTNLLSKGAIRTTRAQTADDERFAILLVIIPIFLTKVDGLW